jgi:2-alkyl-3-oxoalkanoate reductase
MKIFVAGATGVIGHPLLAKLLAQRNDLVALTRSSEKAQTLAEQVVKPVIADVFDTDAVIHAQPEINI